MTAFFASSIRKRNSKSLGRILFLPLALPMAVAVLALALLGCEEFPSTSKIRSQVCSVFLPPPPLPSYHDFAGGIAFKRVALLPLCHESATGNFPSELDNCFNAELTKTTMFEVVVITRDEMKSIFGRPEYSSTEVLPGNLLAEIASRFGVDAVMFTEITHYSPYQPIAIGVRAKLVDARSGDIRWAFDHLFDSGRPVVSDDARHFYLHQTQNNLPIHDEGDAVLQSPMRFARYAAWETYRSLVGKGRPGPTASFETGASKK